MALAKLKIFARKTNCKTQVHHLNFLAQLCLDVRALIETNSPVQEAGGHVFFPPRGGFRRMRH